MSPLVWFITGCSSGFGEHFVHKLLQRGDKVIATGRTLSKIQHLSKLGASVLELDVTSNQQTIDEIIAKAIGIYGRIDVLMNNAGYVSIGLLEDLRYEDYVAQFETNVFGTIKVTKSVLPYLRQQKFGTMVFIGSLSGWVGHPGVSAYSGSKFALEGIVEALSKETSNLGIKTFLIEPGRFRTMLLSPSNMKAPPLTDIPEYSDFCQGLMKGLNSEDRNQPGDPIKLVETVVDLVTGEGRFKGKEIPFRVPLGSDCYDEVKAKCEDTLRLLKEWESVITSTDYAKGRA